MIISQTPFRISFFGGGTDYPAWCEDSWDDAKTSGPCTAIDDDRVVVPSERHLSQWAHRVRLERLVSEARMARRPPPSLQPGPIVKCQQEPDFRSQRPVVSVQPNVHGR